MYDSSGPTIYLSYQEACRMAVNHPLTFRGLDVDATVRAILEGTATETGERFFAALVENLANALNTCSAWVTEYIAESRELRSLAFWANGRLMENFQIDIARYRRNTLRECP
jgi:hypothetical protein